MNKVTELCRELRNNPTEAEKLLWKELRSGNMDGEKFCGSFPYLLFRGWVKSFLHC